MEQKKRSPNFTAEEKYNLIHLVANKYASVLEDKKTNRASVVDRMKSWKKIEHEFNASSSSGVFRDWETLKRFYENRKKEVRKLKAKDTCNQFQTGGGPEVKSEMDSADLILISIMNGKTVNGPINPVDCDNDQSKIDPNNDETDIEFYFESEELGVQDHNKYDDNKTHTERPLKRALIGELVAIRDTNKENQEISTGHTSQGLSWKKASDLQTQINPVLRIHSSFSEPSTSGVITSPFSEARSGSESLKNSKTPLGNKRRRPTQTVRALSSSVVSNNYNMLLDRRLVLIEKQILQIDEERAFQKAKHKLEIELLTMEVEKKKKEATS